MASSFPPSEYAGRRARLRAAMAEHGITALLVSSAEEVCYLSGLTTQSNFVFTALVVDATGEPATLVAREVEAPTAALQAPGCTFAGYGDGTDPTEVVCALLPRPSGTACRIGYQPRSLSLPVDVWRGLDERLDPVWVDCEALLADVQATRSEQELSSLRAAAQLSDIGLRAGVDALAEASTGGQVVGAIQQAMLAAGSDYPGFVPLVRSTEQICLEHVAWTDRPFAPTDTVFLELSGSRGRYHAPLGRTVRPAGERENERAAVIARAGLDSIRAAIRPGRTAAEVYQHWIATVEEHLGHPYARHHCGYVVGLGFPPSWMAGRVDSLRPTSSTVLRAGMTFHIQSWILDDDAGTHALSDTALVTDDGCELLTTTPHHLIRPR